MAGAINGSHDNSATATVTIETKADVHRCETEDLGLENTIANVQLMQPWMPNYSVGTIKRDTESGLGSSHSSHSNGSPISTGYQWETRRQEVSRTTKSPVDGQGPSDEIRPITPSSGLSIDTKHGMQQPKNNLLKLAVRRYMGKDRLFHLVQALAASESEEKRTTEEYIESITSARAVTGPLVPKENEKYVLPARPQRIRKRRKESLADLIQNQRKRNGHVVHDTHSDINQGPATHGGHSTVNTPLDAYNGPNNGCAVTDNKEHIGAECEAASYQVGSQQQLEHSDIRDTNEEEYSHHRVRFDTGEAPNTEDEHIVKTGTAEVCSVIKENSVERRSTTEEIPQTKSQRAKTKSCSELEKHILCEELAYHNDRESLDSLVLQSVMENSAINVIPTLGRRLKQLKVRVNTPERVDKGNQCNGCDDIASNTDNQLEVEVEPDSGSSDDSTDSSYYKSRDSNNDIVGHGDEAETRNVSEITRTYDNDDESGYETIDSLNVASNYVTNNYRRQTSNLLRPVLETISEAEQSAESFHKLYSPCVDVSTKRNINNRSCDRQYETGENNDETIARLPSITKTTFKTNKINSKHFPSAEANSKHNGASLDLLEVYETNKCLQRVDKHPVRQKHRDKQKPKHIPCVKLPKRHQRWSMTPLPPKQQISRCTQTSPKSNCPTVTAPQTNDEGRTNPMDQYTRYQSTKDYLRHGKPDYPLLSRLDIESDNEWEEETTAPVCKERIVETSGCHTGPPAGRLELGHLPLVRGLGYQQRLVRSERVQRTYKVIRSSARNRRCYSARDSNR